MNFAYFYPRINFPKQLLQKYYIEQQIGEGAYGKVWKGYCKKTRETVAIKGFFNIFRDHVDAKRILREISILRQMCASRYIVPIKDVICPNDIYTFKEFFIVMEYCPYDLQGLIKFHTRNQQVMSMNTVKHIMFQILKGLEICKDRKIIHRDLKPANILVYNMQNMQNMQSQIEVKICDFGLARDLTEPKRHKEVVQNSSTNAMNEENIRSTQWIKDPIHASSKDTIVSVNHNKRVIPKKVNLVPTKRNLKQAQIFKQEKISNESRDTAMFLEDCNETISKGTVVSKPSERQTFRLTRHLVTRWYRPPEIILIQDYSFKVDIWSAGCIFAELLGLTYGANLHGPLFQGQSCYPMSPKTKEVCDRAGNSIGKEITVFDRNDQLYKIFNIIGAPCKEDLNYITRDDVRQYVENFGEIKGVALEYMYPEASEEAIDLLVNMLRFSPEKRYSVEQCLQHRFFSSWRNEEKVDKWEISLDYENAQFHLCSDDIRALLLREVNYFHRIENFEFIFGNLIKEITQGKCERNLIFTSAKEKLCCIK